VAPAAASHVLGDLGAILLLTILFTAVTSAGSAELVAAYPLITYDIYRTYANHASSGRQLIKMSRISIMGFGLRIGILASFLHHIGASLEFLYLAMGILIGSAVVPISLALVWKKTNSFAATSAAIIGLACGVQHGYAQSTFYTGTYQLSQLGKLSL
jgi:Na+/proline symporter